MPSSILRNMLLAVAGAGAFAAILGGCSSGTSSVAPQITAPPHGGTTASPPPALVLVPPNLIFQPKDGSTLHVIVGAPNPSYFNIAIIRDSCSGPRIATAQPSPGPFPTPTPGSVPFMYNVSPGPVDGKCSFTFEDMISGAQGTLPVQNDSGGATSPPTTTPPPTPTPTGGGTQLTWNPPSLTFTVNGAPQSSTVSDPNGDPDASATLTGDTCSGGGIATIASFDYGIWTVTPGKNAGKCSFTVTDSNFPGNPQGSLNVTVTAGSGTHRVRVTSH